MLEYAGYLLLAGLIIALGHAVRIIARLQAPTKGTAIACSERPARALVVVDMQEDFTWSTAKDTLTAADIATGIERINLEIDAARGEGISVVAVRHVSSGWLANLLVNTFAGGAGAAKSQGLGLDPRIRRPLDANIVKSLGDAFSSPAFNAWAKANQVGTLRLVGLDRCYCLRATALGAQQRGYAVELVEDATLTRLPKRWPTVRAELVKAGVTLA